jgi:hypothetical protein
MTNNAKEMLKQFILLTLDDDYGINSEAYDMLNQMMVYDRDMATMLHEVVEMALENSNGRYCINP